MSRWVLLCALSCLTACSTVPRLADRGPADPATELPHPYDEFEMNLL